MAPEQPAVEPLAQLAELGERLRLLEREYQRQRQDLRSAYEEILALNTLQEATLELVTALGLEPVPQRLLGAAMSFCSCQSGALLLVDPKGEGLIVTAVAGQVSEEVIGKKVKPGEGIIGWVAQTGEPALINDAPSDPRFSPGTEGESGLRMRSGLCVPLHVAGRLIGALVVVNKDPPAPFESRELRWLQSFASVAAVIIERARLYDRLQEERDRVLIAQEELRRRLARDLHDGPAQLLANLVVQAEYIRKLLEHDPAKVPEELSRLIQSGQQAVHEMRVFLFDLRPIILETQGLPAAVQLFVERHQRDTGPRLHVHFDRSVGRYDPQLESTIFSIVQEAVNNALRHAEAQNVWVRGEEKNGQLVIDIEDDGKGFSLEAVLKRYDERGSFGLVNMRERAELIGGQLTLVSAPGQGTTVTLRVPVGASLRGS
jgi:signal transduction histidine kinase